MDPSIILALAVFAFLLITVAQGVRQVPQGFKWVVQRLGKYSSTLNPGLNFIIPYIDAVAFKVTTKDIVLDISLRLGKLIELCMEKYRTVSFKQVMKSDIFS